MGRKKIKGRGTAENPTNRFERLEIARDDDAPPERPRTLFFHDRSRSVLARNDSPDLGFDRSLNPYRGCEHGCAYCYARPTHEYLGFSAGLDFESRILVKREAPELLRRELSRKSWRPQPIALSGVTDPYQPIERRLRLTRSCLEVLAAFRNPVVVVTKNRLVTRDVDLLAELASFRAAQVMLSIPTLDHRLAADLEPRASAPARRLDAIRLLAERGVPVGVLVAPLIPGLTDHEVPAILTAAARAGASSAGYVVLRLPYGLRDLFESWLRRHRPERADRVLARIRDVRDGSLNDTEWGRRQRGSGTYARQIASLFRIGRSRAGLAPRGASLSTSAFRVPGGSQLSLFALAAVDAAGSARPEPR